MYKAKRLFASLLSVAMLSTTFLQGGGQVALAAGGNTIYVTNTGASGGNGSQGNPYNDIVQAIGAAQAGDTIVFAGNVTHRIPNNTPSLLVDKALTLDGGGNTLTISGAVLETTADVTLKNMTLDMQVDGNANFAKIYASGNHLTLDAINTGSTERHLPTVYAGSLGDRANGSNAKIDILNGTSSTVFQKIVLHDEDSDLDSNVALNIQGTNVKVKDGVEIGDGTHNINGTPSVVSNSNFVSKMIAKNIGNATAEFKENNVNQAVLSGLAEVKLTGANVKLQNLPQQFQDVKLQNAGSKTSTLDIGDVDGVVKIQDLNGVGTVRLSGNSRLEIGATDGQATIIVSNSDATVDKEQNYVTIEDNDVNVTVQAEGFPPTLELRKRPNGNIWYVAEKGKVDPTPDEGEEDGEEPEDPDDEGDEGEEEHPGTSGGTQDTDQPQTPGGDGTQTGDGQKDPAGQGSTEPQPPHTGEQGGATPEPPKGEGDGTPAGGDADGTPKPPTGDQNTDTGTPVPPSGEQEGGASGSDTQEPPAPQTPEEGTDQDPGKKPEGENQGGEPSGTPDGESKPQEGDPAKPEGDGKQPEGGSGSTGEPSGQPEQGSGEAGNPSEQPPQEGNAGSDAGSQNPPSGDASQGSEPAEKPEAGQDPAGSGDSKPKPEGDGQPKPPAGDQGENQPPQAGGSEGGQVPPAVEPGQKPEGGGVVNPPAPEKPAQPAEPAGGGSGSQGGGAKPPAQGGGSAGGSMGGGSAPSGGQVSGGAGGAVIVPAGNKDTALTKALRKDLHKFLPKVWAVRRGNGFAWFANMVQLQQEVLRLLLKK